MSQEHRAALWSESGASCSTVDQEQHPALWSEPSTAAREVSTHQCTCTQLALVTRIVLFEHLKCNGSSRTASTSAFRRRFLLAAGIEAISCRHCTIFSQIAFERLAGCEEDLRGNLRKMVACLESSSNTVLTVASAQRTNHCYSCICIAPVTVTV